MQKELLTNLKKYKIKDTFDSEQLFIEWIESLSLTEIKNLISLKVDPKEIPFPSYLLINKELLTTSDYNKKVEALSKIKNAKGWYHLYPGIFNKDFLESKNFYKDIEMVSKAETAQYCLWVLGKEEFINSPYHEEDLRLIVETRDVDGLSEDGYDLSYIVWDSLATTARNIDSIKSPYHEENMKMLANAGSSRLQSSCSFPERTITHLANNKVSLKDKNHIRNMDLLLENEEIGSYLYEVMTNEKFMNSKYYYRVINKMIEYSDNIEKVILFSIYAVGLEKIKLAGLLGTDVSRVVNKHNYNESLNKIKDELDIIDYEGQVNEICYIPKDKMITKVRKLFLKKA